MLKLLGAPLSKHMVSIICVVPLLTNGDINSYSFDPSLQFIVTQRILLSFSDDLH
jgi:hypothetical protein